MAVTTAVCVVRSGIVTGCKKKCKGRPSVSGSPGKCRALAAAIRWRLAPHWWLMGGSRFIDASSLTVHRWTCASANVPEQSSSAVAASYRRRAISSALYHLTFSSVVRFCRCCVFVRTGFLAVASLVVISSLFFYRFHNRLKYTVFTQWIWWTSMKNNVTFDSYNIA